MPLTCLVEPRLLAAIVLFAASGLPEPLHRTRLSEQPSPEMSAVAFLVGQFAAESIVFTPEGQTPPIKADSRTDWAVDSTILLTPLPGSADAKGTPSRSRDPDLRSGGTRVPVLVVRQLGPAH